MVNALLLIWLETVPDGLDPFSAQLTHDIPNDIIDTW
jgi:hypothetical protein